MMDSIKGQMKHRTDIVVPGKGSFPEADWAATVQILRLAQGKYSSAKKQLEGLYRSFEESELWADHRLKDIIEEYEATRYSASSISQSAVKTSTSDMVPTRPLLSVYCMGNFHMLINYEKVDKWHSQKARSMMKYLLTRRKKAICRDELIEALWPNCDAEVGRNNLKAAVYSLRQTLSTCITNGCDTQIILFHEGQYSISPEVDVFIDTDEFEHCWQAGRRLERDGKQQEAIQQYMLAEEIYKGDYFEDDPYSEWTLLQREALKDNYLAILSKLAAYSFDKGDYENCSHYSQLLLQKDICHEEAYRWLIKCNIALEQYNRAHRWFKVCSDVLRKELDITPDQKTVDLYYHLVQITKGKNLFSIS
ncbi:MAG: BTAD domain-containing putative transcriptional regulator [Chloroflexi bacterium]|nr:BTAD domain-containing putative transcriptional regulator [Chloroflexota bacterium]